MARIIAGRRGKSNAKKTFFLNALFSIDIAFLVEYIETMKGKGNMSNLENQNIWKPPAVERECQSMVRELAGKLNITVSEMLARMIRENYSIRTKKRAKT